MLKDKSVLDKISVAERQLDTAIWLWFNDGDVVSIVQLAGAALGVLDDLWQHQKKGRPHPFSEAFTPTGMTHRQSRKQIKAGQDFAKHARIDPEKRHEYNYFFAMGYLFLAVVAHLEFIGSSDPRGLRRLLWLWVNFRLPNIYTPPVKLAETPEEEVEIERLRKLSKIEFFNDRGGEFVGNPPRPDVV